MPVPLLDDRLACSASACDRPAGARSGLCARCNQRSWRAKNKAKVAAYETRGSRGQRDCSRCPQPLPEQGTSDMCADCRYVMRGESREMRKAWAA